MAILGWLLTLLAKLGLDFWTHRGPAPIVVEAEKAGGAQQAISDMENTDAKAQQAASAASAVDRTVAGPAGLRQYEQTDPNNRDNAN